MKKVPTSLTAVQGSVCVCLRLLKHSFFVFSIRYSYFPYVNPVVIPKDLGKTSIPSS